jgi:hypothetical protein
MSLILPRRGFLGVLAGAIAAPMIVPVKALMAMPRVPYNLLRLYDGDTCVAMVPIVDGLPQSDELLGPLKITKAIMGGMRLTRINGQEFTEHTLYHPGFIVQR